MKILILSLICLCFAQDLKAAPTRPPDRLTVVSATAKAHVACNGVSANLIHSSLAGQFACLMGVNMMSLARFVKGRHQGVGTPEGLARASLPIFSFSIAF